MTGRIVLLGATGYTGRLILDALRNAGAQPVLAGRNRAALQELAESTGPAGPAEAAGPAGPAGGLETAVADVTDPASLAALVTAGDVLISTVGPFAQWGLPAAQAAADVGAHYVDTTGEVGFVQTLRAQLHRTAQSSGSVMVPAFGYDYVPGILAGTMAARRAGGDARAVDVGYFATGPLWKGLTRGTRATMREGLTLPAPVWRGMELVDERTASATRTFTIGGRRKRAFLVPGTEVLFLPEELPEVESVTVYNGWFPELSRALAIMSGFTGIATKIPGGQRAVEALAGPMINAVGDPPVAERARTGSHVVAVASGEQGAAEEQVGADEGVPLAEVHLEGPNIYELTGNLVSWAAQELAAGRGDRLGPGVQGPVGAFGFDALRDGCAVMGLAEV